jgi:hypothetical protein
MGYLPTIHSGTFYQTGCDIISGIFIIPFVVLGNFFSYHTATKEKKQKNAAWLD